MCINEIFIPLDRLIVVYIGLLFIKSNEKHNTNDRRKNLDFSAIAEKSLALFLLLFSIFHSQIFQSKGSHIFVQGKAIVFSADFIQTKTEKGKVYISKGATIYSEGYIANAEFITKTQTLNDKFSHKSQKTTLKRFQK